MILGGVIQLYVGGVVTGGLTGIDPTIVMALLMTVIGIYILLGGLWGSMTADFVQFITAIALTLVFAPLSVFTAGNPSIVYQDMVTNLGDRSEAFLSIVNFGLINNFFFIYALGLGCLGRSKPLNVAAHFRGSARQDDPLSHHWQHRRVLHHRDVRSHRVLWSCGAA